MFKKKIIIISILLLNTFNLYAENNVTKIEQELIVALNGGVKSTQKFLTKVPTYQLYEYDKTILHYAVELNNYDVVEFLVFKDVELSRKGGIYYGTALQDAIFYGHLKVAKLLIQNGTNLDIKNIDGDTALHIATKNEYTDIVELLLANGASKHIQNAQGLTPYDLVPSFSRENSKRLKDMLKLKDNPKQNHKKSRIPSATFTQDNMDFNGAEFILDRMNFDTSDEDTERRTTQNKSIQIDVVGESAKIRNSNIGININSN